MWITSAAQFPHCWQGLPLFEGHDSPSGGQIWTEDIRSQKIIRYHGACLLTLWKSAGPRKCAAVADEWSARWKVDFLVLDKFLNLTKNSTLGGILISHSQGQSFFELSILLRIAGVSKVVITYLVLLRSTFSRELCNGIPSLGKKPHQARQFLAMRPPLFLRMAGGQMAPFLHKGFLSCFKVSAQLPHTSIHTFVMLISVVPRYRITGVTCLPEMYGHVICHFHVLSLNLSATFSNYLYPNFQAFRDLLFFTRLLKVLW